MSIQISSVYSKSHSFDRKFLPGILCTNDGIDNDIMIYNTHGD